MVKKIKVTTAQTLSKKWEAHDNGSLKSKFIYPRWRVSAELNNDELTFYGRLYNQSNAVEFFDALDQLVAQVKSELILAEK